MYQNIFKHSIWFYMKLFSSFLFYNILTKHSEIKREKKNKEKGKKENRH